MQGRRATQPVCVLAAHYNKLDRPHDFMEEHMRAIYVKAVVEMELMLEELTETEKVDLLLQLVNDINGVHPEYQLELYRKSWQDGSLDF